MSRYTAKEMREAANAVNEVYINDNCEYFYEKDSKFNPFLVRHMLIQAAGMNEREEKRKRRPKKKYEYVVKYISCVGLHCKVSFNTLDEVNSFIGNSIASRKRIYRREVGDWEVVRR